jgi:hypothetical protein
MNDDEARYLIDQYNKHISWKTRHSELGFVAIAVAVATSAYVLSVATFFWRPASLDNVGWILAFATMLAGAVMILLIWRESRRVEKIYKDHEKRLTALENYRSRHKSLPDAITLKLIVEKPDDVERLLKDSEGTLTGSAPQT